MSMSDLLRHLETLSRNLLSLVRKSGNHVEIEALRRAEDAFRGAADQMDMEAASLQKMLKGPHG